MLDENEFLAPTGSDSVSLPRRAPYVFTAGGQEYRVRRLPAESATGMFGSYSNRRGPIWIPVNALTGSDKLRNLFEVACEIANRLVRIFLRGEAGRRPALGGSKKFQRNPDWRNHLLFYEYFQGDNGVGIGAGHQTGWAGVVAGLIEIFGKLDPRTSLRVSQEGTPGREKGRV